MAWGCHRYGTTIGSSGVRHAGTNTSNPEEVDCFKDYTSLPHAFQTFFSPAPMLVDIDVIGEADFGWQFHQQCITQH